MDDLKENTNAKIRENRVFTFSESKESFLVGPSLGSDIATKDVVQDWLKGLAASSSIDEGRQKLAPRNNNSLIYMANFNVGTNITQKNLFFKNYINCFYTHPVLTFTIYYVLKLHGKE